jgi:hypothetical protein
MSSCPPDLLLVLDEQLSPNADENTMAAGLRLPAMAPLLQSAKRQDIVGWRMHVLD